MDVTIHLSKLVQCATQRVNPSINHGLWVTMCVYIGSSIVRDALPWWGLLIMREAKQVWELEVYGKSLNLSSIFCIPKTAFQKYSLLCKEKGKNKKRLSYQACNAAPIA